MRDKAFRSIRMSVFRGVFLCCIGGLFSIPAVVAQENADPSEGSSANPVTIGAGGRIVRESPTETGDEAESIFHIHGLWESRYVSEGRDNLDGGHLLSTFTEFSFGPLTFAPWFAWDPDSDYTELNLSLVAGTNLGDDFELYAGYTHLRFLNDNLHDNEIGTGLVYTGLDWIDLGGDAYYSFDAEGTFFELFATHSIEITDRLSVKPYSILGFNAGYVADGHDGANNLIVGLEADWKLSRHLVLNAFTSYNWAIDRDAVNYADDESLGDFFWGGVGFRIDF